MKKMNTETKDEIRKKQLPGIKCGIITLIIEFIILLIVGAVKKDKGTITTNASLCVWIAMGVVLCRWVSFGLHIISKKFKYLVLFYITIGIVFLMVGVFTLEFVVVNDELSWQSTYILMGLSSFATLVVYQVCRVFTREPSPDKTGKTDKTKL